MGGRWCVVGGVWSVVCGRWWVVAAVVVVVVSNWYGRRSRPPPRHILLKDYKTIGLQKLEETLTASASSQEIHEDPRAKRD